MRTINIVEVTTAQDQNLCEVLTAANFSHLNYNLVLIRQKGKLEIIILINNMEGQTPHSDKSLLPNLHGPGGGRRRKRKKITNYVLLRRKNQHLLKKQNQLIITALTF